MSAPTAQPIAPRDWRDLEPPAPGEGRAELPVRCVVAEGAGRAETLAALEAQDYPSELVSVSDPGARAPEAGELDVLLPAGARPEPGFLAAHARWHGLVPDAVSFGPLEGGPEAPAEPLALVRDLTRELTDPAGAHHLAAAEGTLAARAELVAEAGGLPGSAGLRGRLDLAYRLHAAGAIFVAEPGARAHGTPEGLAQALARACGEGAPPLWHELPELAQVVPLPPFREPASARRHERPALTVNVDARGADPDEARATVAGALGSRMGDVEVRVQAAPGEPAGAAAADAIAGDARARMAPSSLEGPCEAPFQATVPAVAMLDPRTLGDLCELALGEEAGALHVTVPGVRPQEAMIELVATSAWRRCGRLAAAGAGAREELLGRLYGERWISGVEVSTRRHGIDEPQVTEHGPLAKATDLAHERAAHLRFRERAEDLAQRAEGLAQRTLAERLRARAEREAAARVERRLAERGR